MKNFLVFVLFLITVISLNWSCDSVPDFNKKELTGYWHSPLPANPKVDVVLFFYEEDNIIKGKTFFTEYEGINSEEPIRNITLSGNKIGFDLPVANTHYSGNITREEIKGGFYTPENPFLKLWFTKTGLDSLSASAAIIEANTPFDINRTFGFDQLKEDFSILTQAILSHPQVYQYHSKPEFDQYIKNAGNKLHNGMNELDFIRVVAPVMAYLKCVHSQIILPDKIMQAFIAGYKSIPLDIVYLNDSAYIRKCMVDSLKIEPGSEILEINGRTAGEILKDLAKYIPADGNNISHKICEINRNFWMLYHYMDNAEYFIIRIRHPYTGKVTQITLPAIESGKVMAGLTSSLAEDKDDGPNAVPVKVDIKNRVAVLKVKSFNFSDPEKYRETVSGIFNEINDNGIENLIVDLRGNRGGQPFLAADLLRYFIDKPVPYFKKPLDDPDYSSLLDPVNPAANRYKGNSYFLTDGDCLSSTGHLLSLIKYHGLGKVVGDIPGGSFSCSDNSKLWKLPNTGLQLSLARTTYTAAVEGFRTGDPVIPDILIKPFISDIIRGKDVTMEYVRTLIRKRS